MKKSKISCSKIISIGIILFLLVGCSREKKNLQGVTTSKVLEITKPSNESKHVFDNFPSLGGISISCEAKIKISDLDTEENKDKIEWVVPTIGDSFLYVAPDTKKGSTITIWYYDLPNSNNDFGDKTLEAKLTVNNNVYFHKINIKIFYTRDATNNPYKIVPNWYYYWSQTSASSGAHIYNSLLTEDGSYTDGESYFEIGPSARLQDAGYYVDGDGIDNFGSTCLHEGAHMTYFLTTWGSWTDYLSRQPVEDKDKDVLKDTDEPSMGYDPTKKGTSTNTYNINDDFEDYACRKESSWINGSANKYDWSVPGKQY